MGATRGQDRLSESSASYDEENQGILLGPLGGRIG